MENGIIKILKMRRFSKNLKMLFPVRTSSDVPDIRNERNRQIAIAKRYPNLSVKYWSERANIKKQRKEHSFPRSLKSMSDFIVFIQSFKNFPVTLIELGKFLIKRRSARDLIDQKFLIEREYVLRPDLAAAHFIVNRGGSVKFLGQKQWIGMWEEKKSLPFSYIPGIYIEGIKAHRTNLMYEGLANIRKLRFIKYLSLRGLEEINDWCLDWISKEYYASLRHLDLSHCKNITYRGLSSFYRFEQLRVVELEGVPDTTELKLACLMLLEVHPNLTINGINLNVPDKIDPIEKELISGETKSPSDKTEPTLKDTKLTLKALRETSQT